MKKVIKFLSNYAILILSLVAVFFVDVAFLVLAYFFDVIIAGMIFGVMGIFFFCIVIFAIAYAILFFRKENFLTPLLLLTLICLGKARISMVGGMFWMWCEETNLALITFLICLFIRLTAIILIRIYKEKLQSFTGEEKVTSDAVFWARVLFKKLMKSIDPNFKV